MTDTIRTSTGRARTVHTHLMLGRDSTRCGAKPGPTSTRDAGKVGRTASVDVAMTGSFGAFVTGYVVTVRFAS